MAGYLYAIIVLACIGVANTIYLSYHTIKKTPVKCIFFPVEWCHKVQFSKYSRTLGIPNSFAGFGIYMAILVLTILYGKGVVSFEPVQFLIWFGFAFSMYFLAIQAFILKAFCTWCVLSAVEFTLLAATLLFWA